MAELKTFMAAPPKDIVALRELGAPIVEHRGHLGISTDESVLRSASDDGLVAVIAYALGRRTGQPIMGYVRPAVA